jgi:hypothetical protein
MSDALDRDWALDKREEEREALTEEIVRLRAFVRKMFDAAHTHDYDWLEDATGIERETAELLGIAWPYEEDPDAHE